MKFTPPEGKVEVFLEATEFKKAKNRRLSASSIGREDLKLSDKRRKESDHLNVGIRNTSLNSMSFLRTPSIVQDIKDEKNLLYVSFKLTIKDNGQGISEEGLDKLFINFNNLQEHEKSNTRGTGLGLSICKQIIENMGGKVTVSSKIGEGTVFVIEITSVSQIEMSENESQ